MVRTYTGADATCPVSRDMAIGLGLMANQSRVTALGRNLDIDTATGPVDIWGVGISYPFQNNAVGYEIVSTNPQDSPAGTGARTVSLTVLDGNYNSSTQIVTLNGLTPVQLIGGPFRAINSGVVVTTGTSNTNVGDLIVRVTSGGVSQGYFTSGTSFMQQALYTIPTGFSLLVTSTFFCVNNSTGNSGVVFAQYTRSNLGVIRTPFILNLTAQNPPYRHDLRYGILVPQQSTFGIKVLSVTANNTSVTGAFDGVLINNNLLN